jgi:hypothetical protein
MHEPFLRAAGSKLANPQAVYIGEREPYVV